MRETKLSTTKVHVCARCGSEKIRKNGHANNGAQRAKCLECERTFILELTGSRYDPDFKDAVVQAHLERTSICGITRTFGVYHQAIMAWVGKNRELASTPRHTAAQPKGRRA